MKPQNLSILLLATLLTSSLAIDLDGKEIANLLNIDSVQQTEDGNSLQGSVTINNVNYQVVCDCNDNAKSKLDSELGPSCDPSKIKLHQDNPGQSENGLTMDEVRNLVGQPSDLKYVDVDKQSFYCLDGRVNKEILGTPGGDAGEFILALETYARLTGNRDLDNDSIKHLLIAYLQYMKPEKFIMCTSDSAVEHLEKELAITGLDLFSPREQIRSDLMKIIEKPENIGDLHIRSIIKNAELYEVNPKIVIGFLKAFYSILWDKESDVSSKLDLEILAGQSNEQAFLEVRSNESCTSARLAPLIKPRESKLDGKMMYVNHIDAVQLRRADLATFFANYVGTHKFTAELIYGRILHDGLAELEITGQQLALNLPFYSINIL